MEIPLKYGGATVCLRLPETGGGVAVLRAGRTGGQADEDSQILTALAHRAAGHSRRLGVRGGDAGGWFHPAEPREPRWLALRTRDYFLAPRTKSVLRNFLPSPVTRLRPEAGRRRCRRSADPRGRR